MISGRLNNGWVIWVSLLVALLLSIAPMPDSLQLARPLWLGMFIAYWAINLPHRGGLSIAFFFGLMLDVLSGTLLGQHGLPLILTTFLVLSLQQRLRMFPLLQQSLVLMVLLGLGQLVQLWLNTLTGNRPPTLLFLIPVPVSALLWPWVFVVLQWVKRRFNVN